MRSVTLILLPVSVAQAHAEELLANHSDDVEDHMRQLRTWPLLQLQKLVDRTLKQSHRETADLEIAMLGKSSYLSSYRIDGEEFMTTDCTDLILKTRRLKHGEAPGAKAKEQKAASQREKDAVKEQTSKAKEEAEWEDGVSGKALAKQKAAQEKAAEAEAKKAAKLAAQAAEEAEMAAMKKKTAGEERREAKQMAEKMKAEGGEANVGIAREPQAKPQVEKADVQASGIENALQQLDMSGLGKGPRGSSSVKALFKAFEEKTMAKLQEENPNLKASQLAERVKKAWEKSCENPLNQKPH